MRVVAYAAAIVLSFVWMPWTRTSTRLTRAAGVVARVGAFIVFAWLTG